MNAKRFKMFISGMMAFLMMLTCMTFVSASDIAASDRSDKTDFNASIDKNGDESAVIDPNTEVTILVNVGHTTALQITGSVENSTKAASSILKQQADAKKQIEDVLNQKIEIDKNYVLLYNGFSFKETYGMLEKINAIDGLRATIPAKFDVLGNADDDILTPSMGNSTVTTGATQAWELGYSGEGSVVAVIDTGILRTHEAFSVMPESGRFTPEYLEGIYAQYGQYMHAGSDINQLYYNAKLPFCWDYYDNDYDSNHTESDHGTHVAGIAAGNNGEDFKGIAPDAQIVVMQAFLPEGGAYWTDLLAALEDCVYLGVDSINMSLGSAAGYSTPYTFVDGLDDAFDMLEALGISLVAAAGNDGNTIAFTHYGNWYVGRREGLASNPDIGLVGSPASFTQSFAVASVVNTVSNTGHLVYNGEDYYYTSISTAPVLGSIEGIYEIVYAGYGSVEEFEAISAEGKLVLVQRGNGLTFVEKCDNAIAAGAAGILLYNNVEVSFLPNVTTTIPFGALSLAQGEAIRAGIDGGNTTALIDGSLSCDSIAMARSSSWETTSDLLIKPEISAPGDGITSAVGLGSDTDYETWSGTSMAAPHISASIALVKQRLREIFPDATAQELNDLAYSFLMSTAHQIQGFVRQQGAGIVDIASALETMAYLTVPGCSRPKLELGDNEDGTFTFTFVVNNIGDTERSYTIVPFAMTEYVYDAEHSGSFYLPNEGTVTVKLINGTTYDVTSLVDFDGPETVTVPANGTATVTITMTATEELMDYFHENCASGMYLEGFIKLVDNDGESNNLSLPFLSFVGDWDYPSMLDRGNYWQIPTGEFNYQQLTTAPATYAGYMTDQGFGLNRYADMKGHTFNPDWSAFSPNGDGILDAFTYMEFNLLRNAKLVTINIEDAEGNILDNLYTSDEYSFRKEYFTGSINGGNTYSSLIVDYDGSDIAENDTVYIVLETWLDHEGYTPEANESGRWSIPLTKDTVAPDIIVTEGGFNVIDSNYVAYYSVHADEERTELLYETGVFAYERGQAEHYANATGAEVVYVTVADYAGNEAFYEVNLETGAVIQSDIEAFDYGRTIIGQSSKNYETGYYDFNWLSFRSDLPGTVTRLTDSDEMPPIFTEEGYDLDIKSTSVNRDGVLYANGLYEIFILDPETFERTSVFDIREVVPEGTYAADIQQIAFNKGTNDLYAALYFYYAPGYPDGYSFCRIDLETAEIEPLFTLSYMDLERAAFAGMLFLEEDELCVYGGRKTITVYDLNGNILREYTIDSVFDPEYNGLIIGPRTYYGGSMLYDENTHCLYYSGDYSWFRDARYDSGGLIRYNLDTGATTLSIIGNDHGYAVTGMFFADSLVPVPDIEIESYDLDCGDEIDVAIGSTTSITATTNPTGANNFDVVWTSADESIASVSGNKRGADIVANGLGETTITCTVMVGEDVFCTEEISVSVHPDYELSAAVNAEGGNLDFVSTGSYQFRPIQEGARYYAKANNSGASNSVATMTTEVVLYSGDVVSFDYFVSSEAYYDFFRVYINGNMVAGNSGEVDWTTFTYTAPDTGVYEITWTYSKDNTGNAGIDTAGVDNFSIDRADLVNVESVSIDPETMELTIGSVGSVSLIAEPAGSNNYLVEWSSSDESIVTVNGDSHGATISTRGTGTATITCTVYVEGEVFAAVSTEVTVEPDYELNLAANIEGGQLDFINGAPYGFIPEHEGDRYLLKSNNVGINNSAATLSTVIYMSAGDTLSFDYWVSSESGYDVFVFAVNGVNALRKSGEVNWTTYTFTAEEDSEYTFEWSYRKDSSAASGADMAKVDNVALTTNAPQMGDVNGDGSVNTADAVLVLRHSMEISSLNEDAFVLADVNGDGSITAADAILILRMASALS